MERVDMTALYPYRENETPEAWTNRVLPLAQQYGTYRQCSIGWHEECSQRHMGADAECACLCHAEGAVLYSVEGHAEGGTVTVTRAEKGELFWPPQEGEPASMWAWWVYGYSLADAKERAVGKESRRISELAL